MAERGLPSSEKPARVGAGKATVDLVLRIGGLFAAIIAVALVFIAINPAFANPNLGVSILRSLSSVAIMGLGLTIVIVVGEIDLSFGAMYGLAANALAVMWIVGGVPVYLAIPLVIWLGALVGLFNGVLVTTMKIPSFIVTLGSYNLLYGMSLWITNTGTFNPAYPPAGSSVDEGQLAFFVSLTQSVGAYRMSVQVFWMLGTALLLAELQIGLALLSPGPHVQQIFLGAVTIGAVALDLYLTRLRQQRAT